MKPTSTNLNFLTFRCSVVLTCLILPAPVALSSMQEDDESAVLARIGALTITVQEYLERIDLTPWPGKDNPGTRDSAKVNALAALVAEKLLSLQAIEQGITTAEKTRLELKALERVLSRDELYKTEVIQKISVTPDEVAAGLNRYASVITLNSFIMRSGESARQLANYLNARNGALIVPTEGIISHDTITIRMGDLTESHEKEAYAIDSVNEARAFSGSDGQWVVFQLLAVSTNVAHANASVAERTAHVLRILKNRKEGNRVSEYLRGIFSQKLEMNPLLFHVFADTLRSIILIDSAAHREEGRYGIRDDDVDTTKMRLRAFLGTPFITSGKYSVSLEEVVDELKYFSIQFSSLQRNAFLQTLNQNLLRIAEAGIVSQEALDRRMNWHSSVQ
ncbi:MAG TPA: hypothetical protein VGB89_02895, partial [Bacteroidota bacterium]